VFESQTKTKLGSQNIGPDGPSVKAFVLDFMKRELDNFLHQNKEAADALLKRIQQSERERKEIAGIKKLANQRAKKANIHNKKLRDCRVHKTSKTRSTDESVRLASMVFITEGDSASGSITKARNVQHQAVFSLRGKPLNCYGMTKKVVYQNEELNLLQHALDTEDGIENLRYNNVSKTFYCYDEQEKQDAIKALRGKPEITRFKGLGEISPSEFEDFIGDDIRLEPVMLQDNTNIEDVLSYYMGKNTPARQKFIIENLKVELDQLKEDEVMNLDEDFEPTVSTEDIAKDIVG